ncbi:multiple C2 and transmembrane domain-containing protein 1-like [Larimichthys crocea]|uniref:multiple C2 and transmembrane domain-containing protein 1-like n=1 Tax=Larimichthys crocea TaxID=215358 RepID=UPI000901BC22|nr:multiple C2 and transmembrane domain-containing protein 1-like [Larimichthys crocea]
MKLAVLVSLLVIVPFQVVTASCVGKTVEVWVANGQSLTGDGPLSEPDPYVKVNVGGQTKQTFVIHSNANPSWWQKFLFYNAGSDMMRIEIWEADSGLRGDDDHLGTCMEQLVSGGSQLRSVLCRAKDQGFVRVMYKCY